MRKIEFVHPTSLCKSGNFDLFVGKNAVFLSVRKKRIHSSEMAFFVGKNAKFFLSVRKMQFVHPTSICKSGSFIPNFRAPVPYAWEISTLSGDKFCARPIILWKSRSDQGPWAYRFVFWLFTLIFCSVLRRPSSSSRTIFSRWWIITRSSHNSSGNLVRRKKEATPL